MDMTPVQTDRCGHRLRLGWIGAIVWSAAALTAIILLGGRPKGTLLDPTRYASHLAYVATAVVLASSMAGVWLLVWRRTRSAATVRLACLSAVLAIVAGADGWAARWQSAAFERRVAADKRYHVFIDGFVRGEDLKRNLLRHHKMDESVGPYTAGFRCSLLDSDVTVGPLGFRRHSERDIAATSRLILCVGGSATFGMTVEPSDRPFPDILEDLLVQGGPGFKDVRVINCGVPGMSFSQPGIDEITRWMALSPDVVVLYEGINYLPKENRWLALPRNSGLASWLDLQRIQLGSQWSIQDYTGNGYRKQVLQLLNLIESAQATPVLVTFAMPFTTKSDDATFAYFDVMQNGHGSARAACKLVETHNRVLREIAADKDLLCVDLAADLNGQDKFFIDTCHFTQAGRQRVAETLGPHLERLMADRLDPRGAIAAYPAEPQETTPID